MCEKGCWNEWNDMDWYVGTLSDLKSSCVVSRGQHRKYSVRCFWCVGMVVELWWWSGGCVEGLSHSFEEGFDVSVKDTEMLVVCLGMGVTGVLKCRMSWMAWVCGWSSLI